MPNKLTNVPENNVGKMTYSEVVKALGRLSCKTLNDCKLINAAIDLINRQEEEKQNLEIELKAMRGAANSYKADNERLREFATSKCRDCAGCTSWKCDCANIEAYSKFEAYQECMARVEDRLSRRLDPESFPYIRDILHEELNKMVGGKT